MADLSRLLIVRQRPVAHAELDQLVAALHNNFGLDPYLARQQLLGAGLAQVAKGEPATLAGLAALLQRHGYPCWIVASPQPAFAPPRLRSLAVSAECIDFFCEGEQRVRLLRGTPAVGVLADLSGELPSRQAKRLLARNAYLGRDHATVFTPAELRAAILKGQPVFDAYLLDSEGGVSSAFRVLPGRFSPEGLGGRGGLGALRNLEAVLELVAEYAGNFRLYPDFGLSPLPGCQPQPAGQDARALLGNLDALTCYGWLVASLAEPVAADRDLPWMPGVAVAPVASDVVGGAGAKANHEPELTVTGDDLFVSPPAPPLAPATPPPLPPPPERPEPKPSLCRIFLLFAAFAGGALLAVASQSQGWRPLTDRMLHSGALSALLAAFFCWGAFACLRLKRRIEDTPTSRVRSLAMGLVELHGRAVRCYALVTPMTQSPCAWYRLRKYRRDSNRRWKLASESDSGHVPFALDDGSGQVMVDPAGATIKTRTRQTGYPGENTLIGAAVQGGADEKWVEELVYEGTSLYVLGYARPASPQEKGLRSRTIAALRRLKLDRRAQRRYDADGDGRLDADEWQVARAEIERRAAAEQLAAGEGPAGSRVRIGKPPRGLPFLIAEAQSGGELSRRYGWYGAVLLLLSLLAVLAAVLQSLGHFGPGLGR